MPLELRAAPVKTAPRIKAPTKRIKSPPTLPEVKPSLLKILREKKKMSRVQLAKLSRLSSYQIESLEGGSVQNSFSKFLGCMNAMGYQSVEALQLMANACNGTNGNGKPHLDQGTLTKTVSDKTFQDGSKLHAYLDQNGYFFGLLKLCKGSGMEMSQIHSGDIAFIIVREGILTLDFGTHQSYHKKDSFFVLPSKPSVKLLNESSYNWTTDIQIFSANLQDYRADR